MQEEKEDQLQLEADLLVQKLSRVTAESEAVVKEKLSVEKELKAQFESVAKLQDEAEGYRKHYQDLKLHINTLSSEKLADETKYLNQQKSRAKTEQKLREAEATVKR